MCNIHEINIIPNQVIINSIANYRTVFDKEPFDYNELLKNLKKSIHDLGFMKKHDSMKWMNHQGNDYLNNHKLFCYAPLTYLCAFLGALFNNHNLTELQEKLTPQILKSALTRLQQFNTASQSS